MNGEICAEILCGINEGLWLWCLIDALFVRRWQERTRLLMVGASAGYAFFLVIFRRNAENISFMIPLLILCTIFCALCWECKASDGFSVCSGYMLVSAVYKNAVAYMAELLLNREVIKCLPLIETVAWLGLNLCVLLWIRRKGKIGQKRNQFLGIFGVIGAFFFGTIFVCDMCFDLYYGNGVGWYLFLLILVLLILWGYYYLKEKHMQESLRLLDLQNDMLEQNYEKVNMLYAENAKLYHDMKHHFSAIEHMLLEKNGEDALGYIESLVEPLHISKILPRTGMSIVDTILYEAEQCAEKKGIRFQISVPLFPENMAIQKKEMCALFANLLDNAAEAAKEEIILTVKLAGEMMIIELQNDYEVTPVMKDNRLETGKPDKKRHGWGSRIIEQIVAKYDGSICYEIEDTFCVKIMINL